MDTSIFIYQWEANARYLALTDHIFAWLERPAHPAVTSPIPRLQIPKRLRGRIHLE